MSGTDVTAKYTHPTVAMCARIENANDDGRPGEIEGSAKRLSVADDLVNKLGLLVKLPSDLRLAGAALYRTAQIDQLFHCNSAAIRDLAESEGPRRR
jgi:hypothetical protein